MPAKPKPRKPDGDRRTVQATFTLDAATLEGLDEMVRDYPDLASRSAAVRKLVRERPKPKPAKT